MVKPSNGSFHFLTTVPSWLTSSIVHAILLLLLALVTFQLPDKSQRSNVLVLNETADVAVDLSDFRSDAPPDMAVPGEQAAEESDPAPLAEELLPEMSSPLASTTQPLEIGPLGVTSSLSADFGQGPLEEGSVVLKGRSGARKARLVREAGGTPGSEAAVASGLKWLAHHQNPDGSWSLDHRLSPQCQGACRHPGTRRDAPLGATALALLPFLGSGHTHLEGDYKQLVDRGLGFLLKNARLQGDRASLFDPGGNYYSHGLGTIVLCEAFALTQDQRLAGPAQALLNEISYIQEPVGGGWRYEPRQIGDTSVVGWQFMALKSGHMAGLRVLPETIQRASHFLDTVAAEDQFRYRYMVQPEGSEDVDSTDPTRFRYPRSMTSVGLLCRMYLGWRRDDPRVEGGIAWLSKQGPSLASGKPEIYYDYYATQVMRHYGGETWEKWNRQLRDALIALQSDERHEAGSWYFDNDNRSLHRLGGRIYCTSLATMILEVYYRHLPIYQAGAVEDDFPL